jgi:hypothetical protein
MKALVLDEIGLFEAKAFSEVDPYTDPLVLTKKQNNILEDLFQRLVSNKSKGPINPIFTDPAGRGNMPLKKQEGVICRKASIIPTLNKYESSGSITLSSGSKAG